jgi:hypothetical protein
MHCKTQIQYVLPNTNPVCITKHQSSMHCKTQIQYLLQSTKLVPGYVLQNTNPLVIVRKDIDVNEHVLPNLNPVYMYYQT